MVTRLKRALGISWLACFAGCTGMVATAGSTDTETDVDTGPGGVDSAPAPAKLVYPGKGFVVHEWGTDTVVVGSDGSLQRGLHHEEEDLPAFVYDRVGAGALDGSKSVHVKMETPVTYFYSEAPRSVNVSVGFPRGVLTQWYPAVAGFYPFVAGVGSVAGLTSIGDPALDVGFPFTSQTCADNHGAVGNGLLDWGTVEVLERKAEVELAAAPLDEFTWSYAREVDANLVRVSGVPGATAAAQNERFLFYRGVGNFELPVVVKASEKGGIHASNTLGDAVGEVFVLNVGASSGAFNAFAEGIAPGGVLSSAVPSLEKAEPIDGFVESLGDAVTQALDRSGLYHDEAMAMVHTWKRQWFRTPGVRVLYLAPQPWTDASIPLSIEPAPESTVRVMMIRVEVITPALEAADVAMASKLADAAQAAGAKAYFTALGRFAEPRLRRALALLGDPAYGAAALAEIASTKTAITAGE